VTRPQPAAERRRQRLVRDARLLCHAAAAAAVLGALLTFVVAPLAGHLGGPFEDFQAYWQAAVAVAHGHDPYLGFHAQASVVMSGFDYPPPALLLVAPLAVLSHGWAARAFLWLDLAATCAAAVIVCRTVLPPSWPRTSLALVAALLYAPAAYNYWHGQINPLVFLCLALALRAYLREEQVACGIFLALGADIKLEPVVLGLLLLRRGWWRGLAAMAAACLIPLGLAAGLVRGSLPTWVHDVLPALARDNGWIYNQSLDGVASRVVGHSVTHFAAPLALLHAAVLGLDVAVLALVVLRVRPVDARPLERATEFAVGVTAMVLVATIAWVPHYTSLLIPAAVGLRLAVLPGARHRRLIAAATAAFLVVTALAVPLALAHLTMAGVVQLSTTPLWWPFLQLSSLPALAALALLVALARSGPPRGPCPAGRGIRPAPGAARPGPAVVGGGAGAQVAPVSAAPGSEGVGAPPSPYSPDGKVKERKGTAGVPTSSWISSCSRSTTLAGEPW